MNQFLTFSPVNLRHLKKPDNRKNKFIFFRFGVNSVIYKSLMGVTRASIFDTLAELVIVKKPCGMDWDKKSRFHSSNHHVVTSRASGTVTHSPQHVSRKGKSALKSKHFHKLVSIIFMNKKIIAKEFDANFCLKFMGLKYCRSVGTTF
jgi:hypothetical protein